MFALTYYLWKEILDEVVNAQEPLFLAMQDAANDISVNRELVEELKASEFKEISNEKWHFLLKIELYGDNIGGFGISLLAAEAPEIYEQIKLEAASKYDVSIDDLSGFEAEHGLDMDEEVFKIVEDRFGIDVEYAENGLLFELVVFDSEDIDNT
jgi:hypothetical protein